MNFAFPMLRNSWKRPHERCVSAPSRTLPSQSTPKLVFTYAADSKKLRHLTSVKRPSSPRKCPSTRSVCQPSPLVCWIGCGANPLSHPHITIATLSLRDCAVAPPCQPRGSSMLSDGATTAADDEVPHRQAHPASFGCAFFEFQWLKWDPIPACPKSAGLFIRPDLLAWVAATPCEPTSVCRQHVRALPRRRPCCLVVEKVCHSSRRNTRLANSRPLKSCSPDRRSKRRAVPRVGWARSQPDAPAFHSSSRARIGSSVRHAVCREG